MSSSPPKPSVIGAAATSGLSAAQSDLGSGGRPATHTITPIPTGQGEAHVVGTGAAAVVCPTRSTSPPLPPPPTAGQAPEQPRQVLTITMIPSTGVGVSGLPNRSPYIRLLRPVVPAHRSPIRDPFGPTVTVFRPFFCMQKGRVLFSPPEEEAAPAPATSAAAATTQNQVPICGKDQEEDPAEGVYDLIKTWHPVFMPPQSNGLSSEESSSSSQQQDQGASQPQPQQQTIQKGQDQLESQGNQNQVEITQQPQGPLPGELQTAPASIPKESGPSANLPKANQASAISLSAIDSVQQQQGSVSDSSFDFGSSANQVEIGCGNGKASPKGKVSTSTEVGVGEVKDTTDSASLKTPPKNKQGGGGKRGNSRKSPVRLHPEFLMSEGTPTPSPPGPSARASKKRTTPRKKPNYFQPNASHSKGFTSEQKLSSGANQVETKSGKVKREEEKVSIDIGAVMAMAGITLEDCEYDPAANYGFMQAPDGTMLSEKPPTDVELFARDFALENQCSVSGGQPQSPSTEMFPGGSASVENSNQIAQGGKRANSRKSPLKMMPEYPIAEGMPSPPPTPPPISKAAKKRAARKQKQRDLSNSSQTEVSHSQGGTSEQLSRDAAVVVVNESGKAKAKPKQKPRQKIMVLVTPLQESSTAATTSRSATLVRGTAPPNYVTPYMTGGSGGGNLIQHHLGHLPYTFGQVLRYSAQPTRTAGVGVVYQQQFPQNQNQQFIARGNPVVYPSLLNRNQGNQYWNFMRQPQPVHVSANGSWGHASYAAIPQAAAVAQPLPPSPMLRRTPQLEDVEWNDEEIAELIKGQP